MAAFPCSVCEREVDYNRNALECDHCSQWVHVTCNKLDLAGYNYHQKNPEAPFFCLGCLKKYVPFSSLDNNQFNLILKQGVNYLSTDTNINYIPRVRDQKLFIQVNQAIFNHIHNVDLGEEDGNNIETNQNCKYYGIQDFCESGFKEDKSLSVFHLNIHSIEAHISDLRIILSMLNFKFDFICISESKIRKNIKPRVDINIDGYQPPEGTPTVGTKGGVLIYAKNGINFKPRPDLNTLVYKDKVLESFFIEAINTGGKNHIVGVIYRHPSMAPTTFVNEHLKPLMFNMFNSSYSLKQSYIRI